MIIPILVFSMMYGILLPPKECNYEPLISYIIIEYPLSEISDQCLRPKNSILACTYYKLFPAIIIMPKIDNIITKQVYDTLLIHEKAHINCGQWHEESF